MVELDAVDCTYFLRYLCTRCGLNTAAQLPQYKPRIFLQCASSIRPLTSYSCSFSMAGRKAGQFGLVGAAAAFIFVTLSLGMLLSANMEWLVNLMHSQRTSMALRIDRRALPRRKSSGTEGHLRGYISSGLTCQ